MESNNSCCIQVEKSIPVKCDLCKNFVCFDIIKQHGVDCTLSDDEDDDWWPRTETCDRCKLVKRRQELQVQIHAIERELWMLDNKTKTVTKN